MIGKYILLKRAIYYKYVPDLFPELFLLCFNFYKVLCSFIFHLKEQQINMWVQAYFRFYYANQYLLNQIGANQMGLLKVSEYS